MSCPHEPHTLLWLYGESEDEASTEAHLVDCERCCQVVAEHEAVEGALAGVGVDGLTVRPAPEAPAPANRPGWLPAAALAVAAAVVLTVVGLQPTQEPIAPADTDLAIAAPAEPLGADLVDPPLFTEVDADLEALDLELADLSHDLHTL